MMMSGYVYLLPLLLLLHTDAVTAVYWCVMCQGGMGAALLTQPDIVVKVCL